MSFIDFNKMPHLKVWEGVHGAIQHSEDLTFAHITLEKDAVVPEHHHINEQWTHVIEGQLEFSMEGKTVILTPGMTAYMPPDQPHGARAITTCKVIDCFRPVREDFKTLEPWINP
jgi:quercetin dioxygenase-like cupin family protein